MSSMLFGVESTDPGTYVAVALILMIVGLLTCYIPARRAGNMDPLQALHYD
jgi:putative ABC transport system permease protein